MLYGDIRAEIKAMFSFEGAEVPVLEDAPLAQLVEQLTLNQWVPGSNP